MEPTGAAAPVGLSDEQARIIEEKRRAALERLEQRRRAEALACANGAVAQKQQVAFDGQSATVVRLGTVGHDLVSGAPVCPVVTGPPSAVARKKWTVCPFAQVKFELLSRTRFAAHAPFNRVLNEVYGQIPGGRFEKDLRAWTFPAEHYASLKRLLREETEGVEVETIPATVVQALFAERPIAAAQVAPRLTSIDSTLVSALKPFQKQGVEFAIRQQGRVLIADDMGLGKTVQAICVAAFYRAEWPLLIITPSSVRLTWAEAIRRWLPSSVDPDRILTVMSAKDTFSRQSHDVFIFSYDLAARMHEQLAEMRFHVIIADESHFLKNQKAARTKTIVPLLRKATRAILLSGTPALSRPIELYTQVTAVRPSLFPSAHEFGVRYCAGVRNNFGWDFSGASNLAELSLVLRETVMIRRLKSEVLSELPAKGRKQVYLSASMSAVKSISKGIESMSAQKDESVRKKMQLELYADTSAAKRAGVCEYIADLLEGVYKFLVFAHHRDMLDAIESMLEKKHVGYIRIDGSTHPEKRQEACDRFQSDATVRVAVLSITAANAGLTLTAAALVLFAELFWNPGVLLQAEDRVHRIGQESDVSVHYLLAKGTVDDVIWPMLKAKLDVLGKCGLTGGPALDDGADKSLYRSNRALLAFESAGFTFDGPSTDRATSAPPLVPGTAEAAAVGKSESVVVPASFSERPVPAVGVTASSASDSPTVAAPRPANSIAGTAPPVENVRSADATKALSPALPPALRQSTPVATAAATPAPHSHAHGTTVAIHHSPVSGPQGGALVANPPHGVTRAPAPAQSISPSLASGSAGANPYKHTPPAPVTHTLHSTSLAGAEKRPDEPHRKLPPSFNPYKSPSLGRKDSTPSPAKLEARVAESGGPHSATSAVPSPRAGATAEGANPYKRSALVSDVPPAGNAVANSAAQLPLAGAAARSAGDEEASENPYRRKRRLCNDGADAAVCGKAGSEGSAGDARSAEAVTAVRNPYKRACMEGGRAPL